MQHRPGTSRRTLDKSPDSRDRPPSPSFLQVHPNISLLHLVARGANRLPRSVNYKPISVTSTAQALNASTDPALRGRPEGFDVPLRDVRLAAGAGFIVVLTDNVMTLPGLPKRPSAELIDLDQEGQVVGLF